MFYLRFNEINIGLINNRKSNAGLAEIIQTRGNLNKHFVFWRGKEHY